MSLPSQPLCMSARAVHTAWGGTHPEPKTQTPTKYQGTEYSTSAVLLVSCSCLTESYISTRRSVDQNPVSEHTQTAPLLETGL